MEILIDDDVHHCQRKSGVRPWINRQIPVCTGGCTGAIWIDDHEFRALTASLLNEWPQVDVVPVNVRRPGNDVAGMTKLLWFGAQLHANNGFQTGFASRRTDVASQLRSSQSMEKSPIHGSAVQRA